MKVKLHEQQDETKIGLKSRPGKRKKARRLKHKSERRAAKLDPEYGATYTKYQGWST